MAIHIITTILMNLVFTKENEDGTTDYSDEVEINAGWKTIFVYWWAKSFYSHRQRKWLKLLKK